MKSGLITVMLSLVVAGCSTTSMMTPRDADSPPPTQVSGAAALQSGAAQSFAPARQTYGVRESAADDRALRAVLSVGYTGGGGTILPVTFVNESTGAPVGSSDIKAGSGAQLSVGAEYRFDPGFALQGTVGYQMDDAVGLDGSARFVRDPIELIGFVHLYDGWRLGLGARVVEKGRLRGEGTISTLDVNLDRATGGLIDLEYLFSPHAGVKLRYARENYRAQGYTGSVSGNQAGVFISAYF